ncbi:hypothetical protein PP175_09915 [Aneurinibacillus sp. Ricciae_BoGa-3]|uniref:hypothetical protein n=1 Tax=Aneurinibacillus sp. Ricciae_BoGa-3 TaxID=3022697 RepID=UPI0023406034|nr:hypothetical protein [Aneurinibacillus sp. Ricciae_BoGa-3]WCK56197.1 hypothetical protein PP175_09915 [Aneurinibacillus sp. Ricciae_BoGa-3]
MRITERKHVAILSLVLFIICGSLLSGCVRWTDPKVSAAENVEMRKFPYPYRSMVAFASDIDGTTPQEFVQYHRFLNTEEMTPMGQGLGLDVGDSFFIYDATDDTHPHYVDYQKDTAPKVMTFFNGLDIHSKKDADMIAYYWKAGWIDSMHGYGDFNHSNKRQALCTRPYAKAAWDALKEEGISPDIWINHGNEANKQNFGAYSKFGFASYQQGDNPGSPFYHTDLLLHNGVRYVWNSKGDSTFGMNSVLFPIALRDGHKIWGFHRYSADKKIGWTWGPNAIYLQLTDNRLQDLVNKQHLVVIAQHFGGGNGAVPFNKKNADAFRLLASYQRKGDILVARTSRLLHYNRARDFLKYHIVRNGDLVKINIDGIQDPIFGFQHVTVDDVRGITFYVPDPGKASIFIGTKELKASDIVRSPADFTGRKSVGIAWFAPVTYDYTKMAPKG